MVAERMFLLFVLHITQQYTCVRDISLLLHLNNQTIQSCMNVHYFWVGFFSYEKIMHPTLDLNPAKYWFLYVPKIACDTLSENGYKSPQWWFRSFQEGVRAPKPIRNVYFLPRPLYLAFPFFFSSSLLLSMCIFSFNARTATLPG